TVSEFNAQLDGGPELSADLPVDATPVHFRVVAPGHDPEKHRLLAFLQNLELQDTIAQIVVHVQGGHRDLPSLRSQHEILQPPLDPFYRGIARTARTGGVCHHHEVTCLVPDQRRGPIQEARTDNLCHLSRSDHRGTGWGQELHDSVLWKKVITR